MSSRAQFTTFVGSAGIIFISLAAAWSAWAASTGVTSPGSAASDSSNGGHSSGAWTNPSNVTSSDDVYATSNPNAAVDAYTSQYLYAQDFSFDIPDSATINGVEVTVERSVCSGLTVTDSEVKLVKGGTITGNNKAAAGAWPSTDATATYGSASDTWGVTLTASDVESSAFGVVVAAETTGVVCKGEGEQFFIDHLTMTIHYTVPSPPPVQSVTSSPKRMDPLTDISTSQLKLENTGQARQLNTSAGSGANGNRSAEDGGVALRIETGKSLQFLTKPPDADRLQNVRLRVNGKTHFLKSDQLDPNNPHYLTDIKLKEPGTYRFALTADWGITTRTQHGVIEVTEPKPPAQSLVTSINVLFRQAFGRNPTQAENEFWRERITNQEITTFPELLGAMQWHSLHDIDINKS